MCFVYSMSALITKICLDVFVSVFYVYGTIFSSGDIVLFYRNSRTIQRTYK